jgi:hypothetical protein
MGRTGLPHPECYARKLQGCSTEISREHPIPDSILRRISGGKPFIFATNLMSEERGSIAKKDTRKSLGYFILCRKHNTTLSNIDSVGRQFVDILESRPTNQTTPKAVTKR